MNAENESMRDSSRIVFQSMSSNSRVIPTTDDMYLVSPSKNPAPVRPDNSCHNCAHHNVDLARGLGYSDEQLAAIAGDKLRDNDDFSDKEKAVLDWADKVTDMSASRDQAAFDAMRSYFSDAEIVELTYTTALWNCSNRLAEALHLTAEPAGQGVDWGTD